MDFSWSQEQRALYGRMREVGAEVAGLAAEARMAKLAEHGVLGLSVGRDHGGEGWDLVSTARAYEGLGHTLDDGGLLLAAGAHLFGVAMPMQVAGTEDQKKRWLPGLADGSIMATIAATEKESGSRAGAVEAVVESTAAGLRARGEKNLVTYADGANVFLFLGRDGPTGRGLTAALVEAKTSGVTVGSPFDTVGLSGARLAPVSFVDCAVDSVLGKAGAGMAAFQIAMGYERALVLAFRLGAMQRGLDEAVVFAKKRKLGGDSIVQHDAVLHRLARMKRRLETSRLLVYRAAWALDQTGRAPAEAALAKWHVADEAIESSVDAMLLRGGAGYMKDAGLAGPIADALGGSIHSGTQDVLATIVGRHL